jgi:hypothetical protein
MFLKSLSSVSKYYGKTLTADVMDIYWGVLRPLEPDELSAGIQRHMANPDRGRFMPTAADIIASVPEDFAAQRLLIEDIRQGRAVRPKVLPAPKPVETLPSTPKPFPCRELLSYGQFKKLMDEQGQDGTIPLFEAQGSRMVQ